jgi:site-specific recombinase XerC
VVDSTHLKRRGNKWYVQVAVPPYLVGQLHGDTKLPHTFVKALGTSDLKTAIRLKAPWVSEFNRRIDEARRGAGDPQAVAFRSNVIHLKTVIEAQRAALASRDEELRAQAEECVEAHYDAVVDAVGEIEAEQAREAAATSSVLVSDVYPRWIKWLEERNIHAEHTRNGHAFACKLFATWAEKNGYASVTRVNHKAARQYVAAVMAERADIPFETLKKRLSSLARFWDWLREQGIVEFEANPWRGHTALRDAADSKVFVQFDDADVVKLLSLPAVNKLDVVLRDMAAISLFCGLRQEALTTLTKAQVVKREDGWWFENVSSKKRTWSFPVASAVAHIVERRLQSPGGWLFSELETDTDAASKVSKSWNGDKSNRSPGYQLRAGVTGTDKNFHSLRRTFNAACEGAGIPEKTADLISGRSRDGMAYGLYSKGERVNLREAVEKVTYSQEVLELLKTL